METLELRKWVSPSSPQVHHKAHLPSGESPYAQAKRVQLLDKNPNKAISLFWAAINNRDRVDSALKDMAMVMKQVSRSEEAIEAIRSFRYLCSIEAQDSLDNVLLDLYKKCGRFNDQIELLSMKLKLMDEGLCLSGRAVKMGRFPAKKFYVSEDEEKARLLGNLAWAYMQSENYNEAELIYRRALEIEPDNNRQCNLAICLIQTGRMKEAKDILQGVKKSSIRCNTESFSKSFKKASEMLMELEKKNESLNHKFQNDGTKNVSTCDLSDGMSSASPVGRYQAEFSPVSTSNTPTNYVSPPSGFTNHDQDNKKMNSTQEAFFTPKLLNSCPKLESKEQCADQRSSDSISENFESPEKHRTTFRSSKSEKY